MKKTLLALLLILNQVKAEDICTSYMLKTSNALDETLIYSNLNRYKDYCISSKYGLYYSLKGYEVCTRTKPKQAMKELIIIFNEIHKQCNKVNRGN